MIIEKWITKIKLFWIQKYNEQIERLGYDKKIENLNSIVKFNEIIYNTYISYNQNYYNCINLNNLLINYYNNEIIKNNVIKKILKDDYDKVTKLILERKNKYKHEIEKEAQKDKEKIKTLEMENIKLKEEIEILKKKFEEKREINQETEQNMVNENEQTQQLEQTSSTMQNMANENEQKQQLEQISSTAQNIVNENEQNQQLEQTSSTAQNIVNENEQTQQLEQTSSTVSTSITTPSFTQINDWLKGILFPIEKISKLFN